MFDVLLGYRFGMGFILWCFSAQFFPKCNWKYFVQNSFDTACINTSFLEILASVGCYIRKIGHSGLIFSILECLKWKLGLLRMWCRVDGYMWLHSEVVLKSCFTYSMREVSRAVKEMIMTNNCLVSVAYMPSSKILWFQYQRTFFPFFFWSPPLPPNFVFVKEAEDVFKTISFQIRVWATSSRALDYIHILIVYQKKYCRGD